MILVSKGSIYFLHWTFISDSLCWSNIYSWVYSCRSVRLIHPTYLLILGNTHVRYSVDKPGLARWFVGQGHMILLKNHNDFRGMLETKIGFAKFIFMCFLGHHYMLLLMVGLPIQSQVYRCYKIIEKICKKKKALYMLTQNFLVYLEEKKKKKLLGCIISVYVLTNYKSSQHKTK